MSLNETYGTWYWPTILLCYLIVWPRYNRVALRLCWILHVNACEWDVYYSKWRKRNAWEWSVICLLIFLSGFYNVSCETYRVFMVHEHFLFVLRIAMQCPAYSPTFLDNISEYILLWVCLLLMCPTNSRANQGLEHGIAVQTLHTLLECGGHVIVGWGRYSKM